MMSLKVDRVKKAPVDGEAASQPTVTRKTSEMSEDDKISALLSKASDLDFSRLLMEADVSAQAFNGDDEQDGPTEVQWEGDPDGPANDDDDDFMAQYLKDACDEGEDNGEADDTADENGFDGPDNCGRVHASAQQKSEQYMNIFHPARMVKHQGKSPGGS